MSLINCPECKKQISDKAESCPGCGYKLTSEEISKIKEKASKRMEDQHVDSKTGLVIIICLLLIGALIAVLNEKYPSATNNNNITSQTVSHIKIGENKTTVGGHVAAFLEENIDKAVEYAHQRDSDAFSLLVEKGKVIILQPNKKVYIMDVKPFENKIKIRPEGSDLELWTVNEAIK